MTWDPDFPVETLHAGDELFVGDWRCAGGPKQGSWERSRYLEIDLQREGTHVRRLGRRELVVDPTMATLSAAGEEYAMTSTGAPQRGTILFLRGGAADELRLRATSWRVSPHSAELHVRLLAAADPLAREELAFSLVQRLVEDATPQSPRQPIPSWRRLADEVAHVIATRYGERLTLEAIAAAVKASPFHVSRVFRSVTGERVHRHLNRVRLRVALYQLEAHQGRLTELALAAGFSSHSHFTSAFRAEFGRSPTGATPAPGARRPPGARGGGSARPPAARRVGTATRTGSPRRR